MITAAYFTRPVVGGGNLDVLADPGLWIVEDQLDLGQAPVLLQLAEAAYVDGATPAGQRLGLVQATTTIDARGSGPADTKSKVASLIAAVRQITYELHLTLDGDAWAWSCLPANSVRVDLVELVRTNGTICPVTIGFPRQPTPVAGPY